MKYKSSVESYADNLTGLTQNPIGFAGWKNAERFFISFKARKLESLRAVHSNTRSRLGRIPLEVLTQ